jgi:hypothetical protein
MSEICLARCVKNCNRLNLTGSYLSLHHLPLQLKTILTLLIKKATLENQYMIVKLAQLFVDVQSRFK